MRSTPSLRARWEGPRKRRVVATIVAAATAALLVGTLAVGAWRGASIDSASTDWDGARSAFTAAQKTAGTAIAAAAGALAGAQSALDTSAGKVFSEDTRSALAKVIAAADARVVLARSELAAARVLDSPEPDESFFDPGSGLRQNASLLRSYRFTAATATGGITEELAGPTAALATAVAEWQAEQDRIVRERYHNVVQAVGWIPELDQCKGSVDLTAYYGTPAIAEHWSCGGKDFPDDPGTIITLSGVRSGTYRVEGIVKMLNQHRATTADIPHGYDLLYQTCQNGQSYTMSLTALTKIG